MLPDPLVEVWNASSCDTSLGVCTDAVDACAHPQVGTPYGIHLWSVHMCYFTTAIFFGVLLRRAVHRILT